MKTYRPETYGFAWADEDGPRFQLRPEGYRGYIEGRLVRAVWDQTVSVLRYATLARVRSQFCSTK